MTIVTKFVDVFNIFVQAANLGLWIFIVLQATKAAQVWPAKLLKQRAFASVEILQRKCVRSINLYKCQRYNNYCSVYSYIQTISTKKKQNEINFLCLTPDGEQKTDN